MILYCHLKDTPDDFWLSHFQAEFPDADFRIWPDWGDPEDSVNNESYAFVWYPPLGLLKKYTGLRAIFSAGAGVDHLARDPDLPKNIPIVRMSDDSLHEGMREYTAYATLHFHRLMPKLHQQQQAAKWRPVFSTPARQFPVGIMGYGVLGQAAAQTLKPFGYPIRTWSSSPKAPEEGVSHFQGMDQLQEFLQECQMIICMLPSTAETKHLLNAETMGWLPKGAAIANIGRGTLINLDDLIESVTSGHLAGAMIDVFETEPLPVDHPAWSTENITITPHIAAITKMESAAQYAKESIEQIRANNLPDAIFDMTKGY